MNTEETVLEDQTSEKSKETEDSESFARGFSCCEETMSSDFKAMGICPMAGMCKGMMKPGSWGSWFMLWPAMFLIVAGLLIILVPQVLIWLIGGTAIFMGIMMLWMANQFRKFSNEWGNRKS